MGLGDSRRHCRRRARAPRFTPAACAPPPSRQVPFDLVPNQDGTRVFKSDTHRKIALYYGFADTVDAVGHGTHTGGTITGSRCGGAAAGWFAPRETTPRPRSAPFMADGRTLLPSSLPALRS